MVEEELKFDFFRVDDEFLTAGKSGQIVNSVQNSQCLTSLILVNCVIPETAAAVLFRGLASVVSLRELYISRSVLDIRRLPYLCEFLKDAPAIWSLTLHNCGIGSYEAELIAEALGEMAHLRELAMPTNSVCDVGARAVLKQMEGASRRITVDFRGNKFSPTIGLEFSSFFRADHNWKFDADFDNFRSIGPISKSSAIPSSFLKEVNPLDGKIGRRT